MALLSAFEAAFKLDIGSSPESQDAWEQGNLIDRVPNKRFCSRMRGRDECIRLKREEGCRYRGLKGEVTRLLVGLGE